MSSLVLPSPELAARLEAAEAAGAADYIAAYDEVFPEIGAVSEAIAGGRAAFGGADSPVTQAHAAGMAGPVSEEEFRRLEQFFHGRGAPALIFVSPFADASLPRHLAAGGYEISEWNDLLAYGITAADKTPKLPRGIEVRPIRKSEAELWAQTVGRGFSEGQDPSELMLSLTRTSSRVAAATRFLAFIKGAVAGGGAYGIHAKGVASFYGAATLPEFRGRGVHKALIRARLAHAARRRADLAVVTTLPGTASRRNQARYGFYQVYTRVQFKKAP